MCSGSGSSIIGLSTTLAATTGSQSPLAFDGKPVLRLAQKTPLLRVETSLLSSCRPCELYRDSVSEQCG